MLEHGFDFLVWSIQILSEMFERLNGCSKLKIYIFQSKKIFYFCREKMLGSIFSPTSVLDMIVKIGIWETSTFHNHKKQYLLPQLALFKRKGIKIAGHWDGS